MNCKYSQLNSPTVSKRSTITQLYSEINQDIQGSSNSPQKMIEIPQTKLISEEFAMKNLEILPAYGVTLHENKKKPASKLFIENPIFEGKVLALKTLYPKNENQNKGKTGENNDDNNNNKKQSIEAQENKANNFNNYKIQSQKLNDIKNADWSKKAQALDDLNVLQKQCDLSNYRKSPIPINQRPLTSENKNRSSKHFRSKVSREDLNKKFLNNASEEDIKRIKTAHFRRIKNSKNFSEFKPQNEFSHRKSSTAFRSRKSYYTNISGNSVDKFNSFYGNNSEIN